MSALVSLELADPGAGQRLGPAARSELGSAVRGWRRARPGAVLLQVQGDAWHHAPELSGTVLTRDGVNDSYHSLVKNLFGLACPVVLSLDGQVSGFGLALAMAADVRFATGRTMLSVGRPLAALLGGISWLSTHAAGGAALSQLAWTGTTLTADEAIRRGMVVPAGNARALAEALSADATASSAFKRALNSPAQPQLASALQYQSWLADVASGGPVTRVVPGNGDSRRQAGQ